MTDEGRAAMLPSIPLPSDSVTIGGQVVTFRSLSRTEALKLTTKFKDNPDEAEIFVVACGVGVTVDEARNWLASTDPNTAGKVIEGIIMLTGIVDDTNPKD